MAKSGYILGWIIFGFYFIGQSAAMRGSDSNGMSALNPPASASQWNTYAHTHRFHNELLARKPIFCYQCNSAYDPNCGHPFEPYTIGLVNCSLKPKPEHLGPNVTASICRKTVQTVQGKTRVIRDCGYLLDPHDDKQCSVRQGTHDVEVVYCSCTKSECNFTIRTIHHLSVTLIITLLILNALVL